MSNINILAIVESVEKSNSGYEVAIKDLAERFGSCPCTACPRFTSKEIGINGNTLSWLARYGVLKVVGTKPELVCVDEYEELYKKFDVNIYTVDCDIVNLANTFQTEKKSYKVTQIEKRIAKLREQLAQALVDLEEIK